MDHFTIGWFEYGAPHVSLLHQVYEYAMDNMKSRPPNEGGGGKPKARAPFDVAALDLYDECVKEIDRASTYLGCPGEYDGADLDRLYHKARRLLGYEVGTMNLPSVRCHECGGPLVVATDASSAVTCYEGCGVSYPTCTWVELLEAKS